MRGLLHLSFLALLSALGHPTASSAVQSSPLTLLHSFPSNQHLENLAARWNGHLLLSVVSEPFLYDIDPTNPSPRLVHEFSGYTSIGGVIEIAPDVFAVIAGNTSSTTLVGIVGTWSVWSVNMNTPEPTIKLITLIPGGETLNGMTTQNGWYSDLVLIADCTLGALWRVNVLTGDYSIAIQDPAFNNTRTSPRGINGVHVKRGSLYFTNSATRSYGRIPITANGSAAGQVEILATSPGEYDDFAFGTDGNVWIATHPGSLNEVTRGGDQRNMTSERMQEPTSVRFGRGSLEEENTLYMVTHGEPTNGGQLFAVNNSLI
ncbi:hypothetical protein BDR22DRAFT_801059 [Usnea florida]